MGKTKSRIVPFWMVILALATLGWAGCSKAGLSSVTTGLQSSTYVVLMNMAPFAPSTEIYLNDIKSTSPVPPGSYNASYEHLAPNQYDVKFKIAGSDSILADLPASLYDSGSFYTVILYNVDTIHKATSAIKITDDFSNVTGSYAYFRFIDLCPDLPSIDLYLNGKVYQSGRSNADIVVYGAEYTSFQPVAASSFSMAVTLSGQTPQIAHLDNGLFQAGNAYTIILSGSASNPAFPINLHVLNASY
jgi:hypothetical protein